MPVLVTKDFLIETYVKQGLSTWAIERKFGISRSTVYSQFKKHGISARNIAQSHILYARSDFSGDLKEKAYLLGFAIGDLRVRLHNGSASETISIACGSTKAAQIKLVQELFSKYGRVWEGKPDRRGATNVEAFVNRSFSFLLPTERDYSWCAENRNEFFAFLAGFTDAEGSFYISNGKAFISWGNYDLEILQFIHINLKRFGIETPKICTDSLKGYVGSHGYARNKNYSHISCCKKETLRALISELGPFLRHADKKQRLATIVTNLKMRG